MFELKPISEKAIPKALEKAKRYRLLNDPSEAESICRDILEIQPDNQEALIMLILALTDQFNHGVTGKEANAILKKLIDDYQREYYRGIMLEREAKASLSRGNPGSNHDSYEWMEEAMKAFENASLLSPDDNDDPILRWNACVRAIEKHNLTPRPFEERGYQPPLE